MTATTAGAQEGEGDADDGESADIAVPGPESQAQVDEIGPPPRMANLGTGSIEDFTYDKLVVKGLAKDVCHGSLQRGTSWTYSELQGLFGGSPGTLYSCRERWDAANNPDCNGTLVDPATNPNFSSGCWSNHAQGRAWDLMVGRSGGGYNTARGTSVVNWLLAPDAAGNQNARARRLGVQQILFNDRCWNTDGDRGVVTAGQMRPCGIGHFDHVHVDMTTAGAQGNTSYWGTPAPAPSPKVDSMFVWDDDTGKWSVLAWSNLRPRTATSGQWPNTWDEMIAGDWDGNGVDDDILYWDRDTGDWNALAWSAHRPTPMRSGRWTVGYDQVIAGDFDADGRKNDLMMWDTDNGFWLIHTFNDFVPTARRSGYWSAGYDTIVVGDLDDNDRGNDTITWDQDTGYWLARSWSAGAVPTDRRAGTWTRGYDGIAVGDWDSQGAVDETFVWDRDTGYWVVRSWEDFSGTARRAGTWDAGFDQVLPGDWDTDGRVDDMFVWDNDTGGWTIQSWRRYDHSPASTGGWPTFWDQITPATLG